MIFSPHRTALHTKNFTQKTGRPINGEKSIKQPALCAGLCRKLFPPSIFFPSWGCSLPSCCFSPARCRMLHDDGCFFGAFSSTGEITVLLSSLVWFLTRKYNRELRPRDGFALVTMLWIGFAAIASMPLYFYFEELSFTDAFFEAMSGLTTTGATVIRGAGQYSAPR